MTMNPLLARWRDETEANILSLAFIPLSLFFHPILLATGFLNWSRNEILVAEK